MTDDQTLANQFTGCFATSVRLIDRVIASTYDDALRHLGVRSTQVTMLVSIASKGTPTARDLVGTLRMDQTTVSRNLDKLNEIGLISRDEDPTDARSSILSLTEKGREVLREAHPIWIAGQEKIHRVIGDSAAEALVNTASKLAGAGPN